MFGDFDDFAYISYHREKKTTRILIILYRNLKNRLNHSSQKQGGGGMEVLRVLYDIFDESFVFLVTLK